MTLQINSNYLCLPIQKGCLVGNYDDSNCSWENIQLVQCSEISNSSDDLQIDCCSLSPCGKYAAICCSKYLIIYSTNNWSFLSSVKTERKGVSVKFFPKSNVVLLAEKSGGIKFFNIYEDRIEKMVSTLGHNSMLIDALVTEDEHFIITCDRDEKIRVTNYPNVYNIQCYCLGHTQFVCSINILQSDKNILISSSGDNTIRLWEITTGKELLKFCNNTENIKGTACNANFYIKITSLEVGKYQSLIAALKVNSDNVTLLKVTGNISNLDIESFKVIKHSAPLYDIEFWQGNLTCLLQDEKSPVRVYNCASSFAENNKNFKNFSSKLIDYWDLILMTCKKRADMFPLQVQYKKDVDMSDEVKSKIRCKQKLN